MIDAAINHIASNVNKHLMRTFDHSEDIVVVSNILEQDGSVSANVANKIILSLVNVEKDSVAYKQPVAVAAAGLRAVNSSHPMHFNLYLMVASYFGGNNYQEGLKHISSTISYFQGQPVFDHNNSPGLDRSIDKLILEIENLSLGDLSSLWSILSGKYLPSVLYKVRMVSYDSNVVSGQSPVISRTQTKLTS